MNFFFNISLSNILLLVVLFVHAAVPTQARAARRTPEEPVGGASGEVKADVPDRYASTHTGHSLTRRLEEKYKLEKTRHQSNNSFVYDAICKESKKPVIAKFVRMGLGEPDEAKITAQLARGPHIVQLLDADRDSDGQWLILEKSATNLWNYFKEDKLTFTPEQALHVFRQLVAAVQYMHRNHFVHRDLKPANIFLDEEPSSGSSSPHKKLYAVRLGDFGLTDHGEEALVEAFYGAGPCPGGMWDFFAPESIYRRVAHDPRQEDIYALGAVLFFMLIGEEPFHDPLGHGSNFLNFLVPGRFMEFLNERLSAKSLSLSDTAIHLLANTLVYQPEHRLTIDQIAKHPWLQGETKSAPAPELISENLLRSSFSDYAFDASPLETGAVGKRNLLRTATHRLTGERVLFKISVLPQEYALQGPANEGALFEILGKTRGIVPWITNKKFEKHRIHICVLKFMRDGDLLSKILKINDEIKEKKLSSDAAFAYRRSHLFGFVPLFRSMAKALWELHARRIAHSDISSEHFFWEQDTPGLATVVLGDLSHVYMFDGDTDQSKIKLRAPTFFTAPEIESSTLLAPFATDIYSLGFAFFTILTGEEPYTEPDEKKDLIFASLKAGTLKIEDRLIALVPTIEPHALDLVSKMMSFAPEARPDISAILRHPYLDPPESERVLRRKKRGFEAAPDKAISTKKSASSSRELRAVENPYLFRKFL
jgi:serine/threonine protein kinase